EMRVNLKSTTLTGTVPILYILLARSGNTVLDAKQLGQSVEIHFTHEGEKGVQTLYYFSTDLSNDGLRKNVGFLNFLRQSRVENAYIKSASYLMHIPEFSTLRNILLTECKAILQDDSGIPFHFFDSKKWQLRLYGSYAPPLDIFRQYDQPDLADAYSHTTT